MRKGRLAAVAALALLIAPGHWWRSDPVTDTGDAVRFARLPASTPADWPAGLTLEEAWHLQSANSAFAGFSALLLGPGGFHGFTDFGGSAAIPRPTDGQMRVPVTPLPATPEISFTPDVEAAVLDEATGTLWLSYEFHNAIRRIEADGNSVVVRPPALRPLGANSGVEAMARLADGRFLMLSERGGQGFVFPGDPLADDQAMQFAVAPPGDFRPTDMASLPDGRVLVLLRAVEWRLPPFANMLMIGDPAQIRAGEVWPLEMLAMLDAPNLNENYEGLAVEPADDGALILWLISDNNRSALQRTLLLKLRWDQTKTAREGNPREPRNP